MGGYDLKGLYSLEEYYARDLAAYYEALTVGKSHNYYEGRVKADITKWVAYFCAGVAESFENVKRWAEEAADQGEKDRSAMMRRLAPRQRKALELFCDSDSITSQQIADLFEISQRAARNLLTDWVADEFLVILVAAKKSRTYGLAEDYQAIIS